MVSEDKQSPSMRMVVGIHQPNFFPWLSYFGKIRRSDAFIFLDDVDYPRSGHGMGTWSNRVKINIQGKASWIGMPVERFSGKCAIKDVRIADDLRWRDKMVKTIQANYARARNFKKAMAVLEPLIFNPTNNVADFNITAIARLCEVLRIEANTVRQSEFLCEGEATERLINITRHFGGTTYLSGDGAGEYQDEARFKENGIELIFMDFKPEVYGDEAKFIPCLSVIDYLMHGPVDEMNWG